MPVIAHEHDHSDRPHSHPGETLTQQLGDGARFASVARGEVTPIDVLREPVDDGPQVSEFTVRVRSYGKPDMAHRDAERALCEALHRSFGVDEHGHARFDVETGGQLLVFDALAADGEHSDHDEIVRRIPKAETFGERSGVREIPAVVRRSWPGTQTAGPGVVLALDMTDDVRLLPESLRVLIVPQS